MVINSSVLLKLSFTTKMKHTLQQRDLWKHFEVNKSIKQFFLSLFFLNGLQYAN